VLQIALPASYYFRDDPLDERFAWRMFSPVRTVSCQALLYDESGSGKRRLQLLREVHVAWKGLLERGREHILSGFARKWCGDAPGRKLTADISCSTPEALVLVICRAPPTSDEPPARYESHPRCDGASAEDCYARECGKKTSRDCYQALCRRRPLEPDVDLCARYGADK
jgi:hypothetical protein